MIFFDVAELNSTIDLILLILFISIIVSLVFCFVRGLFRGWRYGTYRFIFFAILVTVCLSTLGVFSQAISNYDLSGFNYTFNFQIDNGSETINVVAPLTSLGDTASNVIAQLLKGFHVDMDPEAVQNLAISLAQSLIMILLIAIEGLLLMVLGNFFCFLFWHILFKHFIPKEKRKKKTLRLLSAFQEFAIGAVLLAMFIGPFSAIANSLSAANNSLNNSNTSSTSSVKKEQAGTPLTPTMAETIHSVLDTYDNSLFSQFFFNWNRDETGKSFDISLVDFLTKVNSGSNNGEELTVSFVNELTNLSKTALIAVDNGLLNENGFNEASLLTFLSSSYAPMALSSLASSGLVTSLMPYVLDIAYNIDDISQYVKTNGGFNFDHYDYSKTLNELASVYQNVIDSKILDDVINDDGTLNNEPSSLSTVLVEKYQILRQTIASFDKAELALFENLLKAALWVQITKDYEKVSSDPTLENASFYIKDFFPTFNKEDLKVGDTPKETPEEIASLSFNNDILPILDSIYNIISIDNSAKKGESKILTYLIEGAFAGAFDENTMQKILSCILDNENKNVDKIEHFIDGYFSPDMEGEEDISSSDRVLFDSSLIQNSVPKMMSFMEKNINESLELTDTYAVSLEPLINNYKESNEKEKLAKDESKALFSVLKPFAKNEDGKNFLKNYDTMPGIYFEPGTSTFLGIKDELLSPLKEGLKNLDNSKIVKQIAPKVLDKLVNGENSTLEGVLGTKLDLNFENVALGSSFASLLEVYGECQDLILVIRSAASNLTGAHDAQVLLDSLVKLKTENGEMQLVTLLNGIITNSILRGDTSSNFSNAQNILAALLEKGGFGELKSSLEEAFKEIGNDEEKLKKNVAGLGKFLSLASEQKLLDAFSADSNTLLSSLEAISFEDLIGVFDQGNEKESYTLMTTLFGSILENKLLENENFSFFFSYSEDGKKKLNFSFKKVASWANEGKALDTLIRAASEIGDLSKVDFINGDPDSVESLLKAMSSSSLFIDEDGSFALPEFLSDKFVEQFIANPSIGAYFSNFNNDRTPIKDENLLKQKSSYSDFIEDVKGISKDDFDTEASFLGDVLRYLSSVGSFDFLKSENFDFSKISPNNVSLLLHSLNESKMFRRVTLTHIYFEFFDTFAKEDEKGRSADYDSPFNYANSYYLYDKNRTNEERENEANSVSKIIFALADPKVGALNDEGKIETSRFNKLENLSVDYFLRPFFEAMKDSEILNPKEELNPNPDKQTTVLTTLIRGIVLDNSYYKDTATHKKEELVDATMSKISNSSWRNGDEIEYFLSVIRDLKALGLSLSKKFDFNEVFKNDKSGGEYAKYQVSQLLNDLNSSKLLFPGLALKLKESLSSFESTLGSGFSLGNANLFYTGYFTNNDGLMFKDLMASRYDEKECEILSDLLYESYTISEGGSSTNISDISNFDKKKLEATTNLLGDLAKSKIFNTIEGGSTSTNTVFQEAMGSVFGSDPLSSYYYLNYSPKDKNFATNYTDAKGKIAYFCKEKIGYANSVNIDTNVDDYLINNTKEASFAYVLGIMKDIDGFTALKGSGLKDLNEAKAQTLLNALNKCELTFDIVPNLVAKTIKDGQFNFGDINAKKANPYYEYYENMTPNFDEIYREEEITNLCSLLFNEQIASLSKINENIKSEDLDNINALLKNIASTNVFELGGIGSDLPDDGTSSAPNLPVFEQILYSFYSNSGLSEKAYDPIYDGQYINHQAKLLAKFESYSDSQWEKEIDNLTDFIREALIIVGPKSSTGGLDLSGEKIDFKHFGPGDVNTLAMQLNKLEMVKDSLKYNMKSFLGKTIGLDDYSKTSYEFATSDPNFLKDNIFFPIESLSFEKDGVSITNIHVNYKKAGDNVIVSPNPTTNRYDFNTESKPLGNNITLSGDFDKINVTFSVCNYLVNVSYEEAAIPSVVEFLGLISTKTTSSTGEIEWNYVNLSTAEELTNFLYNSPLHIKKLVTFLKTDNSFFATGFDEKFLSNKDNVTFESSDVIISGLFKINISYHGVNVPSNLNKYLPNYVENNAVSSYQDIFDLIGPDSNIDNSLDWLSKNLGSAYFYNVAEINQTELTFSGNTLSKIYSFFYASKEQDNADDSDHIVSIDQYLNSTPITNLDTFEGAFKSGLAKDLYLDVKRYAQSGTYTYLNPLPPSSISNISLRQSSNLSPKNLDFRTDLDNPNTLISKTAELVGQINKIYPSSTALTPEIKNNLANVLKSYMPETTNENLKELFASYYQGMIYECLVNDGIYHGASSGIPEEDAIIGSPFGDSGYIAKAIKILNPTLL